jgi:hypothetical protein
MADLLDCVVIEVEREERGWRDDAARIFVDEVTQLIADRLGRRDATEPEMMMRLDGVPACVIWEAADRLGVTVRGGVWRIRRRT